MSSSATKFCPNGHRIIVRVSGEDPIVCPECGAVVVPRAAARPPTDLSKSRPSAPPASGDSQTRRSNIKKRRLGTLDDDSAVSNEDASTGMQLLQLAIPGVILLGAVAGAIYLGYSLLVPQAPIPNETSPTFETPEN